MHPPHEFPYHRNVVLIYGTSKHSSTSLRAFQCSWLIQTMVGHLSWYSSLSAHVSNHLLQVVPTNGNGTIPGSDGISRSRGQRCQVEVVVLKCLRRKFAQIPVKKKHMTASTTYWISMDGDVLIRSRGPRRNLGEYITVGIGFPFELTQFQLSMRKTAAHRKVFLIAEVYGP